MSRVSSLSLGQPIICDHDSDIFGGERLVLPLPSRSMDSLPRSSSSTARIFWWCRTLSSSSLVGQQFISAFYKIKHKIAPFPLLLKSLDIFCLIFGYYDFSFSPLVKRASFQLFIINNVNFVNVVIRRFYCHDPHLETIHPRLLR